LGASASGFLFLGISPHGETRQQFAIIPALACRQHGPFAMGLSGKSITPLRTAIYLPSEFANGSRCQQRQYTQIRTKDLGLPV